MCVLKKQKQTDEISSTNQLLLVVGRMLSKKKNLSVSQSKEIKIDNKHF